MSDNTALDFSFRGRPVKYVLVDGGLDFSGTYRGHPISVMGDLAAQALVYLRPVSDSSIGNWTDHNGGTTNLYSAIDEVSADTADYVKSGPDPSNDTLRLKLTASGIVDPAVSTDHIVDYQIGKLGTGVVNLDVRIVQGAVTEIAAWSHSDIAAGPTAVSQTLLSTEADAITDYTDLYIEFTATLGQAYIFRDQFTGSIDSAWTITGAGSSVVDNELSIVGGTNWGDQVLKKTTGISRSAGRAMAALFIPEDREDSLAIGWQTGLGGSDPTDDGHSILHGVGFGDGTSGGGGRMVSANGLKVEVHGGTHEARTIEQLATVVLRDTGAFYLLSNAHAQGANTVGSTDPVGIPQYPEARLLWVEDASSLTPLSPIISAKGTHGYTGGNRVDDYRVIDVAAWASDDALAEVFDRVARADSNTAPGGAFVDQDGIYGVENEKIKFVSGGTWPHTVFRASADGKFRFRLTTPATLTDGFGVVLRQVDANNFLRLWNNFGATTLTLQSWVGGGFNATHVNYTVNWAASTEYEIVVDLSGDKVKVWVEGVNPSGSAGWETCDVLTTGTGYGPFLGGADTRWNDLAFYPHTVTLPAEIQDGAAPHIWTVGEVLMRDTFTAADATALDGRTPDVPVGANTWSTTATGYQISNNRLINTNTNGTDNARYALYDVGVSDVEITATLHTPVSADHLFDGLILRANSDASDRILVRMLMDDVMQLGSDEVELWETIAASPSGNDFHKQNVGNYWVLDADHTFKVQIKDQLMHCFIDDEPIISYHLVGTHTGTYFGFAHSDIDDGIAWESITIRALEPTLPTPSNNFVVGVGDSITVASHNTAGGAITYDSSFQPRIVNPSGVVGGYLAWASILPKTGDSVADGRFQFRGTHATGGLQAGQIKTTHIDGSDSPLNDNPKAGICVVLAGSNDIGIVAPSGVVDPVEVQNTADDIESIWDALIAGGILPVACLLPPNNGVGAPAIPAINTEISARATAKGLVVADLFTPCVDVDGTSWLTGYHNGDGVHPSVLGAKAMGQALRDAVDSILPSTTVALVTAATDGDADLIFENGAMERDGSPSGVPAGGGQDAEVSTYWTFTANGATSSLGARSNFDGQAWRVNKTDDASGNSQMQGTGVGSSDIDLVDGHTYEIGFVGEIAGWSGTDTQFLIQLNKISDGTKVPFRVTLRKDSSFADPIEPFKLLHRFRCSDSATGTPVPSGGYRLLIVWGAASAATTTDNLIDTYLGQLTIRDLGVI